MNKSQQTISNSKHECICMLANREHDTLHRNLRSTWRYPVPCNKGRLQYSICSACMNQTSTGYPTEYMPKETSDNGWAEPNRQGRISSHANIDTITNSKFYEEQKKEGAILCFGRRMTH